MEAVLPEGFGDGRAGDFSSIAHAPIGFAFVTRVAALSPYLTLAYAAAPGPRLGKLMGVGPWLPIQMQDSA